MLRLHSLRPDASWWADEGSRRVFGFTACFPANRAKKLIMQHASLNSSLSAWNSHRLLLLDSQPLEAYGCGKAKLQLQSCQAVDGPSYAGRHSRRSCSNAVRFGAPCRNRPLLQPCHARIARTLKQPSANGARLPDRATTHDTDAKPDSDSTRDGSR